MIKFDNTYTNLPHVFYTKAPGHHTPIAEVVVFNNALADDLSLPQDFLLSPEGAALLSGNAIPEDAAGIAMAYAGHQFGSFTMLGDGRALLLGEVISREGRRYDLHLKGSGPTTYSRRGDGKAAMGPMLREYLISEAMHGLGIPTTRSLAVLRTGEWVQREKLQRGAVLVRVAESHIRVGTFQYAMALTNHDAVHLNALRQLADYAIQRHYPHLASAENPILAFYEAIIARQAALVAQWQQVGFIHGVLNTDNTAISGETIDYGPCAFMDTYHPDTVFSSIDQNGRYAYGQQPYIIGWNLARLGETLLLLLHDDPDQAHALADGAYKKYAEAYQKHHHENFCHKLGLYPNAFPSNKSHESESHFKRASALIDVLLKRMRDHQLDFTETFVYLTLLEALRSEPETVSAQAENLVQQYATRYAVLSDWITTWQQLLSTQKPATQSHSDFAHTIAQRMKAHNPCVIPRNAWVEEALERCVTAHDYTRYNELLNLLKKPYAYSEEQLSVAFINEKAVTTSKNYRTFCGT